MSLSKDEIKRIVENSLLKADSTFEYPPVCLKIIGEFGNQIFSTLGNFSTILAPPKVGKTTATGVIVAALLSDIQISKFISSLPQNKGVIVWIDTEQAKPECVKTIQNICNQVYGNKTNHPSNFIYIALRGKSKDVIIDAIEFIIQDTKNIGFIVIDGIKDLVSSINDEREATFVVEKLLKWTQEANIHILTILHQNKGDANARGHLGTELMNKAETVASLIKDENNGNRITIVEPKFTRHKEFESFAFSIDQNGLVSDSEVKANYDKKNPTVDQLTHDQLESVAKYCFASNKYLSYTPLWHEIKSALLEIELSFGDNKCKDVSAKLLNSGYIGLDKSLKHYYLNGL